MINTNMRNYDYYIYGEKDAYGQNTIPTEPTGMIKMAINIYNQSTIDSVLYKDCEYIGLTHAEVNDAYVIEKDGERLKVLYVNPEGRYKQVYMKRI